MQSPHPQAMLDLFAPAASLSRMDMDTLTQEAGPALGKLDKVWNLNGHANLALHLAILGRLVDRCVSRRLNEYGLNATRWRAIALLSLAPQSTFGELAEYAWFDRGDLSRALRKLEEDGLATRKPHPHDRRSFLFSLTPEGRKIYNSFSKDWRGFEQEFEAMFDGDELDCFNDGLARLASKCMTMSEGQEN
jgi:DNA-binding MarR family transcriptional regulator